MTDVSCFKSYDIRGRLGRDLDAALVARIGQAVAQTQRPGRVVTGRDGRLSSPELHAALNQGLCDGGADVIDIGLCGTEEVYFATDHYAAGGGLMVTASHNPADYNGLKLVGPGARPLAPADELGAIRAAVAAGPAPAAAAPGTRRRADPRAAYVARVLSFVDAAALGPLRVVVNAGNGAAGPTLDAVAAALQAAGAGLEIVRLHHAVDGRFPNGIPNPLLEENRPATAEAVRAHGADLGVAWDGDFDRCFLFDETGAFVDGEYVVGLLAERFLTRAPGARIVHDPRVVWSIQDVVARGGGEAVVARTGHALIKARMREADALYGGEMSAHHYFRDFMHCDSGMIPWLLVAEHLCTTGRALSDLVGRMRARFPASGEINFRLDDAAAALQRVEAAFAPQAASVDRLDGLSLAFADWRMNLRLSNTEPVLRLNVETRGDAALLADRVAALRALITGEGAGPAAGV